MRHFAGVNTGLRKDNYGWRFHLNRAGRDDWDENKILMRTDCCFHLNRPDPYNWDKNENYYEWERQFHLNHPNPDDWDANEILVWLG
jgi:hypothetical protein